MIYPSSLLTAAGAVCVAFAMFVPKMGAMAQSSELALVQSHNQAMAQSRNQAMGARKTSDSIASKLISVNISNATLREAIDSVAAVAKVRIGYRPQLIQRFSNKVNISVKNVALREVIEKVLDGTSLGISQIDKDHFAIVDNSQSSGNSGVGKNVTQFGTVFGSVKDSAKDSGIEGVAVKVEGTSVAAITDKSGNYSLVNVPVGSQRITFKLLGYAGVTRTIAVKNGERVPLSVRMAQTASVLSGVVTTATGTQKRLEVGSDIVKINVDEVAERAPIRSVTDILLHSQIPGVQVTPTSGDPGAPARIRMRGIGSISGNNDPAIIVDGIWISASSSGEDAINRAMGLDNKTVPSRLDDIDPAAIESIEIIRGPSATTLYGQEAANGVIVITTKRGREGDARWGITFNRDWNALPRAKPPRWLGYGKAFMSETEMLCSVSQIIQLECVQDSISNLTLENGFLTNEQGGWNNRYVLNLSGGARQMTYSVTGSLSNVLGPTKMSNIDIVRMNKLNIPVENRIRNPSFRDNRSFTINLGFVPRNNFNLAFNLSGAQDDNRQNSWRIGSPNIFLERDTMFVMESPQLDVQKGVGGSKSTSALTSVSASWQPLSWLNGTANTGMQRVMRSDDNKIEYRRCNFGSCAFINNDQIRTYKSENSDYTGRISFSAMPSFQRFDRFLSVSPGIGLDIRKNVGSRVSFEAKNLPGGSTGIGSAGNLSGDLQKTNSATAGWYVNSQIGILKRFFFDIGLRQDAGSAIKVSNAARYPKLSTSWIISDESFFPVTDLVSIMRFRFAYGHAAVHPDEVDVSGRFVNRSSFINGAWVRSYQLSSIGNARLIPERSVEYETGLDMDMFYDRVQLSLTYAIKNTRNAIVERQIGPSAGVQFASRKENVGKVINKSLEFGFTGRIIDNSFASWTVNASMGGLDNYVSRIGDGVTIVPSRGTSGILEVGYPIGGIWKKPVLGYNDVNGDGFLSRDEIIFGDTARYVGWTMPRFTASYGSQLSLLSRRLTLSAQLSYRGSHVQSITAYDGLGLHSQFASLDEQALALLLAGETNATVGGLQQPVNELRFNSASIAFQLPARFASQIRARMVQMTLQGSNLGLWTNYRGRDPGVNSRPIGEALRDDGNVIPQPRKYALGFKLDF